MRPLETQAQQPELDALVGRLRDNRRRWATLPVARKVEYARGLLAGFARIAPGQVEAAMEAKGESPGSQVAGEEWLSGPYISLRTTRLLIATLERIRDQGTLRLPPAAVRTRRDGRLAIRAFPLSSWDRLLYSGFRAEVRLLPEVTRQTLDRHTGAAYRHPDPEGAVALVLGAGNVASIGPLDAISKLFVEGRVVLLKHNPVNDYLDPFVEDAFGELISDGFFATARGGAQVGSYLCQHPGVDEIHITGSSHTHDAIVFGPGVEGDERKRRGEPLLTKPITSELGNVSPIIVVPGAWKDADLSFHARNVATQMTHNGGFNCNAAKVLVTHRDWPQREAFLDRLGRTLAALPARSAYYPGAEERWERFVASHPEATLYGERRPGVVPPTLVRGVDPRDRDAPAFTSESFCAFSAETALPAASVAQFVERAVEFCNETLFGTLNAEILVDPVSRRRLAAPLDAAVDALRYGTVAFNHWPALSYAFGSAPWGAYPGSTLGDIQSGIGFVHNTFMLEGIEKCVVSGPFRVRPLPVWFAGHRAMPALGSRLAAFEAAPSVRLLAPVVVGALRS